MRNVLAVIGGWLGGSAVNMGLVSVGHTIFPIEGIDPNNYEQLAEALPNLSSEYFLFPFLAHAVGTLVGAFIANKVAVSNPKNMGLIVGLLFFIGGIMVNYMMPGPTWFTATDLILAYFPMAWIAGKLANR